MPISLGKRLDITLTDDGPFYFYYLGKYGEKFSIQIRMTTGVGAGKDDLLLEAEMCNEPLKVNQIESMEAVELDDAFSSVSDELLGDAAGIDNTAGAVSKAIFVDADKHAYWWRFKYSRTDGTADNGRLRINIFEPPAQS